MTQPRSCPRCYAPLRPSESPEGLCPKCLLAVAMGEDGLIRTATGEPVPAPPAIADLAPHFPQLEILSLVGRGGVGAVYRAIQRDLGRTVALKVLLLDPERDPTFGERFAREARAMASLTHPNIAGVHDAGRAGPYWYLLLEFVDGPNLRQLIQARDLPASEALDVVRQICSALEYAHEEGIVHRDIKPENVLVDARGRVKLVDFGLAKLLRPELSSATLTRTSQTMGTWHYMAPEQLRRPLEVDHRADIYSLGVVLYELLTGEIPQGRYEPASHRAHTDQRLDAIVDRALEQDPARRYQQARGVREDVERVSSEPEVEAPRPARHAARREERHRLKERDPEMMRATGQGMLYGCGCLLFAALIVLLGLVFLRPRWTETSDPATGYSDRGVMAEASPGAQRLLAVLRDHVAPTPAAIAAAEEAWSAYSVLERANARGLAVESPNELWLQFEIEPFPTGLAGVMARFLAAVHSDQGSARLSGAEEALRSRDGFPSGTSFRIVKGPITPGESVVTFREGFDEVVYREADVPDPTFQVLWSEPEAQFGLNLPWDLAELGYDRPISYEALLALLAAEEEYLELERTHTSTEPGRDGADVVYVVAPFRDRRAAVVERLSSRLEGMGVALPDLEILMPFGRRGDSTRIWRFAAPGGPRISIQIQPGTWFTSLPGAGPPYQQRFLERAGSWTPGAGFSSEEVGLGASAKAESLAAVTQAWRRYVEEESRHLGVTYRREGSSFTPIAPFRTERGAILDDLVEELAVLDPGWSANGGSPLLLDELFEFGNDASEVEVRARPDGRFEVRTKRGEAERTQVLDELGWRYERFAPPDSRSGAPAPPIESTLTPARLGLPHDLSDAGRVALVRAEARFGELLVLQRRRPNLRAAGGSRPRPGWPRSSLPEEPPIGGLESHVPAFAEARAALLDELFAVLESEVDEVDRARVSALVAPLGARDEVVHAGTWADHFFLIAAPEEGAGDARLVWGGREIDPRFRVFFLNSEPIVQNFGIWGDWSPGSDSKLDLRALRGSRIRPTTNGVVDTDVDLVFPSTGAEYLLSGYSSAPTMELVLAAEDAWDAYVELLEAHRRLTAWSIDGEPFIQVDLASFEGALEAWRAATLASLVRASGDVDGKLPALPGTYARAELHVDGSGVKRFKDASPKPVLDVLRSSLPSADELQELLAGARPLDFALVDAVWPWGEIAPPASFPTTVMDVWERYVAVENEHSDVRLARLGGGVEIFVQPHTTEAQPLRDELDARVRAAAATGRPRDSLREVDLDALFLFARVGGVVSIYWEGERPQVGPIVLGNHEHVEDAPGRGPGLERFLAPDLAERARLWCAPEDLGFDRPLSPAARWNVARARWAYLREVSIRRRTIEPPQPVLPQPVGSRRQLRLEGSVVHLVEFSDNRRAILDPLLADLRALGEEPADPELLELTLAPFGRRAIDLAITNEDGQLTIWGEVRERDALEMPDENRIGLVYEGPTDDWRWYYWSR